MRIEVGNEGAPPDIEKHFYLCRCGLTTLQRINGGAWRWVTRRPGHVL